MATSDGSGGIDPIMRELFAAEADAHLPVLNEGLLALEKGRAGKKEIEAMMRAAHSIKGAARIVGNEPAVRVAHALEDCFTAAKEERIALTSDAVDVLLQGVDALQRTCSPESGPALTEESMASLLQNIAAVREGKTSASEAAPAKAPMAPVPAIAATVAAVSPVPVTAVAVGNAITFPSHLDAASIESIRRQLCTRLDRTPEPIHIDFNQVQHLGAAGLALLLSLAGEARGMKPAPSVQVHRLTPGLRSLFRVVGLESVFILND
jgi:two-component system sensor histidine kinase and response regulator WspE